MSELHEAIVIIKCLLSHLTKSTDVSIDDLVHRSPAAQLRLQADAIEKRDKDIQRAREFLSKHGITK